MTNYKKNEETINYVGIEDTGKYLTKQNEQNFYSALKDLYVGEEVEGDSGFVKLMEFKKKYFDEIIKEIKNEVEKVVNNYPSDKQPHIKEEIFEKLWSFFGSYFTKGGSIFFNDTPIHKNLYERVYSNREDTELFWKTSRLYYVKSETNYESIKVKIDNFTIHFDASQLKGKKANEIKKIKFLLVDYNDQNQEIFIKVVKDENNDYNALRNIIGKNKNLSSNKMKPYILNNLSNLSKQGNVILTNNLNLSNLTKTLKKKMVNVIQTNRKQNNQLMTQIIIDIAPNDIDDIGEYFDRTFNNQKKTNSWMEKIKKAVKIYKRQKEVDYFIHKDAESFLKEQFKIFMFHYIYKNNILDQSKIKLLDQIKGIAFKTIENIAHFENELKAIWEKPKFVKNSNYVVTLDKLKVEVIEDIIKSEGFETQIEEWKSFNDEKNFGWKEFDFDKNDILKENKLNEEYKYLPIDTKYFSDDIKYKILSCFDNLDEELDGRLIKSDNWQALNTIMPKYKEAIDLIYIDPPFNTGNPEEVFEYKDGFQDSTWLTLMENRLELSKKILKETGSIYVHLDQNANYLGREVLNNKFGKKIDTNFRAECVWSYSWGIRTEKCWNRKHDSILMYSKSDNITFNANEVLQERKLQEQSKKRLKYTGAMIVDKNKRKEKKALPTTIFNIPIINAMAKEKLHFKTQKPEELLDRMIKASSNKKDIILDYFLGSGTTSAVSHKLNRDWIGVEMGDHFDDTIIPRMKKVLAGDESGISKQVDWKGGGFFKYYELEQYEETLKKCKYQKPIDNFENYSFNNSKKLTDVMDIDEQNQEVYINFNNLYDNIDLAETFSNLTGMKIKEIKKDGFILSDENQNTIQIDTNKLTLYYLKDKNIDIRPLIWWKSKK